MDRTEDIIARLKAGEIDEAEAQRLLDEDMAGQLRYRQEREVPIGLLVEDDVEVPDVTEGTVLRVETVRELLALINSLPKRQGQCVELYYFDHLTQAEVAERLGITQQTVGEHLAAGHKKLAAIVAADPVFSAATAVTSEGIFVSDLMCQPHHNSKHAHPMRFPFEVWQRWCVGAGWSGNNVYAARYENRLHEYLCACFDVPPLVGYYTRRRR